MRDDAMPTPPPDRGSRGRSLQFALLTWLGSLALAAVCFGRTEGCFNSDEWFLLAQWAAAGDGEGWKLLWTPLNEHVVFFGRLILGGLYEAFGTWHPPYQIAGLVLHGTNVFLFGLLLRVLGVPRRGAAVGAVAFCMCHGYAESLFLVVEIGYLSTVALTLSSLVLLELWLGTRRLGMLLGAACLASLSGVTFPARVLTPLTLLLWLGLREKRWRTRRMALGVGAAFLAPAIVFAFVHFSAGRTFVMVDTRWGLGELWAVLSHLWAGVTRGLIRPAVGVRVGRSLAGAIAIVLLAVGVTAAKGRRRRMVILCGLMILALYGVVALGRYSLPHGYMSAPRYAYLPSVYLFLGAAIGIRSVLRRLAPGWRRAVGLLGLVVLVLWMANQTYLRRAQVAKIAAQEREVARISGACRKAMSEEGSSGRFVFCETHFSSAHRHFSQPLSLVAVLFPYGNKFRFVQGDRLGTLEVAGILSRAKASSALRVAYGLDGASEYLNRLSPGPTSATRDALWPNRAGLQVRLSEIAHAWDIQGLDFSGASGRFDLNSWPCSRWLTSSVLGEAPEGLRPWPSKEMGWVLRRDKGVSLPFRAKGSHPSFTIHGTGPGPGMLYLKLRTENCEQISLAWRVAGRGRELRWLVFRAPPDSAQSKLVALDMRQCPDFHGQELEKVIVTIFGVNVVVECDAIYAG